MKSRAKDRDRACLGSDFRFQGGLGNVFVGRPGGGGQIAGCVMKFSDATLMKFWRLDVGLNDLSSVCDRYSHLLS